MSGAAARRKGAAAERAVARGYRDAGVDADRCLLESREGNIGDLTCDAPIVVQVKAQQNPSVWRALAEAQAAAGPTDYAIAHVWRARGTGRPTERIVAMSEADWYEIVGLLVGNGAW